MSKLILPGLIDPHVHLREPGNTQKEDFYTGTAAALAGGYTTIMDMPNNNPPTTTLERLEEKISLAKKKIVCDVGFHFGSLGDNLNQFTKVKHKVTGLKLYLNETTGNFLIDKKLLEKIFITWYKNSSKPILLHAEDEAVQYVMKIVQRTGQKVHFCHISTAFDLKQIIKAKERGLPITCGVTSHHLFLTEHDAKRLGPFGKMKPPLRSKKDVEFLWKHMNFIDIVESDHAPHTKDEKESKNPPYGVPGLETTLPLLLTAMSKGLITLQQIINKCYTRPKEIFHPPNQPKAYIEVDESQKYEIRNENLFTKCKWSPFNGWKVKGKVVRVFIRGKKVFENGKILVNPGFGKII